MNREDSVRSIMASYLIALVPALIWGVYAFGWRALVLCAESVLCCIGFQAALVRLFHRGKRTSMSSAVVLGLFCALMTPASAPLWVMPILCLVAVLFSADVFGGVGKGFIPSVAAARILYFAAFPALRGRFPLPFTYLSAFRWSFSPEELAEKTIDLTPLQQWSSAAVEEEVDFSALLTGSYAACIGEGAALLIFVGMIYLMVRRVIPWQVPVLFLGTAALLTFLFPRMGDAMTYASVFLLSGGTLFCAAFVAPLFGSVPMTPWARAVYGVLCGGLCVLFRYFLSDAQGAVFAVFVAGAAAPWIDRLFSLRSLGLQKRPAAAIAVEPTAPHKEDATAAPQNSVEEDA